MAQLIVTLDAERDLHAVLAYLQREAGSLVAEAYRKRFRNAILRIKDSPETGAPRRTLGANARIIIMSPYLVVYDYIAERDTAVVLRILHGRRNITEGLLRRHTSGIQD